MTEKKRLLSSLHNALLILRSYTLDRPEQGITEIAQSLQMGKSTVHRIVSTLAEEGFLTKDPETQKYKLGYSVLALCGVVTANLDIYNESLPIVRKLVDTVGETAHIGILEGTDVIYLLKVECNHYVRFLTHVGRRNPLHCTSSGKVLLAHKDPSFIENYLSRGLKAYTANTIHTPDRLLKELAAIKKQGYATSYEELLEGVHSVAAPVYDYTGQVVAAVTVVGPKQRMGHSKTSFFVKHVVEASNTISRNLGYYNK
jgi:IclR family KDG regulon transcriptional repressor